MTATITTDKGTIEVNIERAENNMYQVEIKGEKRFMTWDGSRYVIVRQRGEKGLDWLDIEVELSNLIEVNS